MNANDLDQNDTALRALLRSARPAPPLPPRFQQGVWRRLELAEGTVESAPAHVWVELLFRRWLRPRVVLAGMAALIFCSGFAGALRGTAAAKESAKARYLAAVAPTTIR